MPHEDWNFIANGRSWSAPLEVAGAALLIHPDTLEKILGWHVSDNTLCQADRCLPLAQHPKLMQAGLIDLSALCALLRMPLAVAADARALAIGEAAEDLAASLVDGIAPDFALPDLGGKTHRLSDFAGQKVLLVTWASWCGCREDLAQWQALYEELGPQGLTIITVAEDSAEAAAEFIERAAPTHPALFDPSHLVSERYGFINVPTAVWIDERGRIARPPRVEHASNVFQFAHGLDCEPHQAALRHWVATGQTDLVPDETTTMLPTPAEQQARAHHALAFYLHANGHAAAAAHHWELAGGLAPYDWTIRRGSMPLTGKNPFGGDFATLWEGWEKDGRPDYASLAAARARVPA